jgi:hypothetical protein
MFVMMWDTLQGEKYCEARCVVADPSIAYSIRCVGRLLSVDTAAFYNDSWHGILTIQK